MEGEGQDGAHLIASQRLGPASHILLVKVPIGSHGNGLKNNSKHEMTINRR